MLLFRHQIVCGSYTPQLFIVIIFFFFTLLQFSRFAFSHDPTSLFFDSAAAHIERYTALRRQQALHYLDNITKNPSVTDQHHAIASTKTNPSVCVGVVTVARQGARYFRPAIGSLLEGLDARERADINLVALIAHSDPTKHPAYNEEWLGEAVDEVLSYKNAGNNTARILEWERQGSPYVEKGMFDYNVLLNHCIKSGSEYVVIFEDDFIALDGWYHRMKQALTVAKQKTRDAGRQDFLYLRLFYTELFHGWNSEFWRTYLTVSLFIAVTHLSILLYIRRRCVKSPSVAATLSTINIALLILVCTPLFIGLFFAAGRSSMLPLPRGVNQMPKYGCCAQAMAYPASSAQKLANHFETILSVPGKAEDFIDSAVEKFADATDGLRWAMTPVVMQHVGSRSSKAAANVIKNGIWNYQFERNDAKKLRREHLQVLAHYSSP